MYDMYYDINGQPITEEEWFYSRRTFSNRRIALTASHGIRVSTVWLGLDHAFDFGRRPHVPIIFETMVFGIDNNDNMWRYATLHDARKGHWEVCAQFLPLARGVDLQKHGW